MGTVTKHHNNVTCVLCASNDPSIFSPFSFPSEPHYQLHHRSRYTSSRGSPSSTSLTAIVQLFGQRIPFHLSSVSYLFLFVLELGIQQSFRSHPGLTTSLQQAQPHHHTFPPIEVYSSSLQITRPFSTRFIYTSKPAKSPSHYFRT